MEKIRRFDQLIAWQEAHKLTLLIYSVTNKFPDSEKFNLISQLRRAAVSVESCIAEGFCRYHYKERLNFYYDSRGSVGEIQSQIMDAKDLHFVDQLSFMRVIDQSEFVSVVLGGLIRETERRSKNP